MSASLRRNLLIAATFLAGYVLLDWVSYLYPISPLGITPWNPAAGLCLVMLWRWGRRALPLAALAAVVADIIIRGAPTSLAALTLGSLWTASIYALAVHALDRLKVDSHLSDLRDVIWFTAIVGPATFLAAVGYVSAFVASETLSAQEWLTSVLRFWIGDLNGILVSAPALLVWHLDSSLRATLRELGDAGRRRALWEAAAAGTLDRRRAVRDLRPAEDGRVQVLLPPVPAGDLGGAALGHARRGARRRRFADRTHQRRARDGLSGGALHRIPDPHARAVQHGPRDRRGGQRAAARARGTARAPGRAQPCGAVRGGRRDDGRARARSEQPHCRAHAVRAVGPHPGRPPRHRSSDAHRCAGQGT